MGAPDKNWRSFSNQKVGKLDLTGQLVPPDSYKPHQDTLKFSNAWDADITTDLIEGGLEDCADANNKATRLKVYSQRWRSGGKRILTLKGGLGPTEWGGVIEKHGSSTDIEFDQYSDQSHDPIAPPRLNYTTTDGSPVHYKSWMGVRPVILNPEQKYVCDLYLPYPVGIAWNRLYQFLKIFGVP